MRNKKMEIVILIIIVLSLVGIGIAFAAFSQTLTINGAGTVESSSWSVVFEGADGSNTIGAPTLTGTAQEITHPTIKNNSSEISTYEVTLKTPGDSITYNFKIHNKGDYAAKLSSLTIGQTNINNISDLTSGVSGYFLTTDSSAFSNPKFQIYSKIKYRFYYTDNNIFVGKDDGKDCLEPGESVRVSLKLTFSSSSETSPGVLPSEDIILDDLGISAVYNQHNNGFCYYEGGERENVTDVPFDNYDGVYYTYEGKSFIGTGVDNLIISENITSLAKYASAKATQCSDGSTPTGPYSNAKTCPEGSTPVFADSPATDAAAAYCSGCRLMTYQEASSWDCANFSSGKTKCIAKYNGSAKTWWLNSVVYNDAAGSITQSGTFNNNIVTNSNGVRPVADIPSTATMTGSGTSTSPYVITTH